MKKRLQLTTDTPFPQKGLLRIGQIVQTMQRLHWIDKFLLISCHERHVKKEGDYGHCVFWPSLLTFIKTLVVVFKNKIRLNHFCLLSHHISVIVYEPLHMSHMSHEALRADSHKIKHDLNDALYSKTCQAFCSYHFK